MEGWLKAVDAKTGKVLWKFKTPSGIIGNPMTYNGPDGKQYVAVLSGIGGWSGIGVAAGIGPEDPTAGLGALGAFGDAGNFSNQGGVLTVFALKNMPRSSKSAGPARAGGLSSGSTRARFRMRTAPGCCSLRRRSFHGARLPAESTGWRPPTDSEGHDLPSARFSLTRLSPPSAR